MIGVFRQGIDEPAAHLEDVPGAAYRGSRQLCGCIAEAFIRRTGAR
jgi:hypothetical protein